MNCFVIGLNGPVTNKGNGFLEVMDWVTIILYQTLGNRLDKIIPLLGPKILIPNRP